MKKEGQGLEGVKVIEIARTIAATYAGKLMADLGAEVIKIEPPGGEPVRDQGPFPPGRRGREDGGLFFALNGGKRSLVLDLLRAEDQDRLYGLTDQADILVHDHPPRAMKQMGLDYRHLSSGNPKLVMASITPFGQTGPHSDYAASDLTLIHGGGWGWLCPTSLQDPDLPPIKPFGQHALIMGGVHGAMTALAGHYGALTLGRGEHIDLSVQEIVASILEQNFVKYTYEELVATRLGLHLFSPWGFYPCQDGKIFMVCVEEDQWDRLKEMMGHPEWADMEVLSDAYLRGENQDVVSLYLSEWTANWKVQELFHACQERRICAAPVFTFDELTREPHLKKREFLVEREYPGVGQTILPGAPYRLRNPWWRVRHNAPTLDEARGDETDLFSSRSDRSHSPKPDSVAYSTGRLPLEGVRILDLTWVWAGPYCTLQLAHLGAEVIKVESTFRPDLGRRVRIFPLDMNEEGINRSGYFNQWGQAKRSITVNISKAEGADLVRKLAGHCDVVVDNFATGVTDRLGLGPDDFLAVNPELIVASICGYGKTGPLREYMGYGPAIAPLSGLTSYTGYDDGEPQEIGVSYSDPNGGVHAAFAIVSALSARKRFGGGQVIDLSLWEATACSSIEGWMGYVLDDYKPMGNRDPRFAPHNLYRCKGEDEWVAVAVTNDKEWQALCRGIERPDLARDERFMNLSGRKQHEDEIEQILAEWCASRDTRTVTHQLQAVGVPAFPSLSSKGLTEDKHLNERGFFSRLDHPEVGVRTHAGIPWRLTHGRNGIRSPAPCLGADTDDVLGRLLGLSKIDLDRLREEEVLA